MIGNALCDVVPHRRGCTSRFRESRWCSHSRERPLSCLYVLLLTFRLVVGCGRSVDSRLGGKSTGRWVALAVCRCEPRKGKCASPTLICSAHVTRRLQRPVNVEHATITLTSIFPLWSWQQPHVPVRRFSRCSCPVPALTHVERQRKSR